MLTTDRSNLVNCNAHILSYLWYLRRREYHRVFHQVFNANAVKIFESREARAAHQLVHHLTLMLQKNGREWYILVRAGQGVETVQLAPILTFETSQP